jgi:NADH-quinone oxidoreductase subunit A
MPPWSLLAYSALVIALVAGLLAVSHVLGPRTRTRATEEVFESGVLPVGDARVPVNAKFYLIAMFFVIFDLEAVFVYAWAVALDEVGWTGFIEMAVFIGVLLAALAYLWRLGALDWTSVRRRAPRLPGVPVASPPRQESTDALVTEQA